MKIKRAKGHGLHATFSVDLSEKDSSWHVKLRPAKDHARMIDEAMRTRWAHTRFPIPTPDRARVMRLPGVSALITETIEGTPSHQCIETLEPHVILRGLSSAITSIRNIGTLGCIFKPPHWTTEQGIEENLKNLQNSKTKRKDLHPDFADLTFRELKDIADIGDDGQKAVSHGDLCMPNVLIDDKGNPAGIVDLGELHIGSPNLDLAIMSWVVQANMGNRWAHHLLAAHGADSQEPVILHNRLAYDLGLERPGPWEWVQAPQLHEQRERLAG